MDFNKSLSELKQMCKDLKISGYSNKNKSEIVKLLETATITTKNNPENNKTNITKTVTENGKIHRLNYIGSKFQLLDWLTTNIKEKTGWTDFKDKKFADLFAGTGIVSHHFRSLNSIVLSNDAELYSSIISHAFNLSIYSEKCKLFIKEIQENIANKDYKDFIGYITIHYSPYNNNERMFFTVENAQIIDYIRNKLEDKKSSLNENEYKFLLASLLISADAVSNVPAVYGCFLKKFKDKAKKTLNYVPIHNNENDTIEGSKTYNSDVLDDNMLCEINVDFVYMDPPYNERQYSKNYFPLNIIAKTPKELETEKPLKGKTGIPVDCFMSPFCKKGKPVEEAFEKVISKVNSKWIFISYNSESLVSKDKMLEIMKKYGNASVVERDYKRFKSFEYNEDVAIKEYLFCLQKN
jgi:adenine-specific DNA-methyltransferase